MVSTNSRGEVLVDFEFAATRKRDLFKKAAVRLPCEAGAISRVRNWSDASGKFRIQAALLSVGETTVSLRMLDMSEVEIETARLSDIDQRFSSSLEKRAGPAAAPRPAELPVEEFSGADGALFGAMGGTIERAAIIPDPLPAYLKLTQGGVGFGVDNFFDRVGAVLPIGGPDAWLLTAVVNGQPGGPLPTRLLWASLARQKIEGRQLLLPGERVLDYHAPSHRLLTYFETDQSGLAQAAAVLALWEVLPSDKQVKPVVRWNVATDDRPRTPWARLIDGNTVLHRYKGHEFVAWDVREKRVRYRVNQESFFAPDPALSGGRKYLLIPDDKQVRMIASASGEVVSLLPVTGGAAAVALSEDGRRAAVLGSNTLSVWDLTSASNPPEEYQAEAIGTPFRATMQWVGDDRLMVDDGHTQLSLFSLKHKLVLWSYEFDMSAIQSAGFDGSRLRDIVDRHLVYAAAIRDGQQQGLAVGAVRLPGPHVDEAAAALDPDTLMVMKPGSAVKLDVRAGGDTARITSALTKKIEANGWRIDPGAAAVMTAEMKRGETQQVTYRMFGSGGNQSASVTPHISSLQIEIGGQVAWQSGTSTGAPPMISLREGQTAQSEVDQWQRPQPEFFETVNIPWRILDPAKRKGVGVTQVTTRGLVVQ